MKYDIVYSLGNNCGCAEYLRDAHLRSHSGPLDWIISDDVYASFKTILDEFDVFLDFSCLEQQSAEKDSLNIPFLHTKNKYLFLHDFFKEESLTKQMPLVAQKYQRRIKRLMDDLQSKKRILFCWYGETGAVVDSAEAVSYCLKIRRQSTAHIDFLFILYDQEGEEMKSSHENGIFFYQLPKSLLEKRKEGYLMWDKSHIAPIFSQINIEVKTTFSTALRKVLYRIASVFIFNRSKRHKFIEDNVKNS